MLHSQTLLATVLLSGGTASFAATTAVDFILSEGSQLAVQIELGDSEDEATVLLSGSFRANIAYDAETLAPQSIAFTGGAIQEAPYFLEVDGVFTVPGLSEAFSYQVNTQDIVREPRSPTPAPIAANGAVDLVGQELARISGTRENILTFMGIDTPDEIDYAENPEIDPFFGAGSLQIVQDTADAASRILRFTFNLAGSRSSTGETGLGEFEREETIGLTAIGEATVPVGESRKTFSEWLAEQGLGGEAPPDENQAGIPLGLLHAFDLPRDARSLPLVPMVGGTNVNPGARFHLALPTSGLNAPLALSFTHSLTSGAWMSVSPDHFTSAESSLTVGASGTRELLLPLPIGQPKSLFLRLEHGTP